MIKILVLNGPNLNLLGIREPDIYGSDTYDNLCTMIKDFCAEQRIESEIYQSNHEGDLVDKIQAAALDGTDGIVINPAAYTHTSVAIADALKAVNLPSVEVHISDVDSREAFRRISYVSPVCIATVKGQGFTGYIDAVKMLVRYITEEKKTD